MKKVNLLLLLALALLLNACASHQAALDNAPPPDLRSKYIHAIDRAASANAITVYWVKAPSNEELESRLYGRAEGE